MDPETHAGVLVLWDLENCRLPEGVHVAELVRDLRARYVEPKTSENPQHRELGFVISLTETVRLPRDQEEGLRFTGVQIRRCLGKRWGKGEEAESYLGSEYNFVKNIANIVANKQLAHIVLLGGDRDCHSIFETALVDRVKCELLYVPGRVNHNYLRGIAARGVKCYNYCSTIANIVGHEVKFLYNDKNPEDPSNMTYKPGQPELFTGADGAPTATPSMPPNTTPETPEVCKYWLRGSCAWGDKCFNIHPCKPAQSTGFFKTAPAAPCSPSARTAPVGISPVTQTTIFGIDELKALPIKELKAMFVEKGIPFPTGVEKGDLATTLYEAMLAEDLTGNSGMPKTHTGRGRGWGRGRGQGRGKGRY